MCLKVQNDKKKKKKKEKKKKKKKKRKKVSICPSIQHSHSWVEPAGIFLFGTMVHHIKFMLGIAHQLPWHIFDLSHDLLSISCIYFQTHSWMKPARILDKTQLVGGSWWWDPWIGSQPNLSWVRSWCKIKLKFKKRAETERKLSCKNILKHKNNIFWSIFCQHLGNSQNVTHDRISWQIKLPIYNICIHYINGKLVHEI